MKEKVLQAMREFGAPVNAGKIAEITGIDRKEVDKAFAELNIISNASRNHLEGESRAKPPSTPTV